MPTAERMSEAKVSLRVAFYPLDRDLAASDVDVAIDGAQLRTGAAIHFSIAVPRKARGRPPGEDPRARRAMTDNGFMLSTLLRSLVCGHRPRADS
jgi:hypothetical protein